MSTEITGKTGQALAELEQLRGQPCTCGAGWPDASSCPDCRANLRLRAAGQPDGYRDQLPVGTRVKRRGGTVRGTVRGYYRNRLTVAVDGGGSDTAPAHFGSWLELTAAELGAEQCAAAAPGHPACGPWCPNPMSRAVPTDAERQASIQAETAKLYPGTVAGTVALLQSRAISQDVATYSCEGCGMTTDPLHEDAVALARLVEHAAHDHLVPAGLVATRVHTAATAAQLRRMLGVER